MKEKEMHEEHLYTRAERIRQLRQLAGALDALIPLLEMAPKPPEQLVAYHAARERAYELTGREFRQEEITALGRSVPDLFYRYREWEPPAEQMPDGSWKEADWFAEIEARLQPVLKAAEALASIGCY